MLLRGPPGRRRELITSLLITRERRAGRRQQQQGRGAQSLAARTAFPRLAGSQCRRRVQEMPAAGRAVGRAGSLLVDDDEVLRLETDVQPAQADHSFAGVVFDVAALCDWEATLRSFSVAGQLGTVSVYAARNGWCSSGSVQRAVARSGWGNANDIIDPTRWELVARGILLQPHGIRLALVLVH